MKIYHVPRTRSVRVIWLCAELGVPLEVETISFSPEYRNTPEWRAKSPTGKVPVLEDGALTMYESGAMVQYVLEKHGNGRLQPAPGTVDRGLYLQWCWFAEATFARPIGDMVHHTLLKPEPERIPAVVEDGRARALVCLDAVESRVSKSDYLVGNTFSAADIMMGYTLLLGQAVNLLGDGHPATQAYYERLAARAAFRKATADAA